MQLKPLTIANLRADSACKEGMAFVTPLIEAEDPAIADKLLNHREDWWLWAAARGYDVFTGLSPETIEAKGIYIEGDLGAVNRDILWLGGTATIQNVEGGTIQNVEGGTIQNVEGGTIQNVRGGTIQNVRGGTIQYVRGGTIQYVRGGTIQYVRGGTIQNVWGGTIQYVWGGTIQNVWGGTIPEITGTATVVWYLFTPPSNVSDRAIVIHRQAECVTVIGCGFKTDDRGAADA